MMDPVLQTAAIIDDHPLARMAIRGLLEKHQIAIIGEFDNGLTALKALSKGGPDIVIIDVDIPGMNGVEVVEKLREQEYAGMLIVVSAKNDRYYSKRCAEAGANAFISKKQGIDDIISAIDAARKNYSYFPFYLDGQKEQISDVRRLELLSAQEMKVMSYILSGLDNAQIGDKMHISAKTVSTYKTRLMEKLGFKSLIELLSFAHHNKLS